MAHMLDLDDGCLRRIFLCLDPLPDRFSVAQACKRFHSISGSCSMWLRVQHKSASLVASGSSTSLGSRGSASTEPEREDKLHTTLQSAVAASRPGDTIVLDGGEPHCAKDVVVPWPLQIKGGGAAPEDTVLTCPKGADAALDVRASGRVANLTIHTCVGPCILHRAGHLRVETCQLKCDARGLEHLCAPLVTVASGNADVWLHCSQCISVLPCSCATKLLHCPKNISVCPLSWRRQRL
eukprot:evm.model.scf_200EXC.4 EVM.evm.TU.scf_200EXC.4   scf_200EXC:19995-21993(-)